MSEKNIRLITPFPSNNKGLPEEVDQPHWKMVTIVLLFQHFYSNHPEKFVLSYSIPVLFFHSPALVSV